ncbi:MAG: hypothetical protein EHM61_14955 [Acidobacteria bacterium]|nr:MAG: hypothetical protein EHM61_14955 [Acidobacteriota bacterium]
MKAAPAKKQVRSCKRRRPSHLVVFVVFLLSAVSLSGGGVSRKDRFWDQVDVAPILQAGLRHQGPVSEQDFEQLIRHNFRFIYFNALREDLFLSMPKPEKVASRIARVFELSEEIRTLVKEGRGLSPDCPSLKRKQLADELARSSEQLYATVHDFFAEGHVSRYECRVGVEQGTECPLFSDYLNECAEICGMLDEALVRYFLNPAPGVVRLSDYGAVSIEVLSVTLRRLSLVVSKSMD